MSDKSDRQTMTRHVVLSSLSNYIGKFINLISWFVLAPFLLNHLGDRSYGLWVLVGSVTAYGFLLNFGITDAITKYVAEYRAKGEMEQARSIIATGLLLNAGLGLLLIFVSVLLAPFFTNLFNVTTAEESTATWLFLLSGIGVGLAIPCGIATAVLRGLQRFDLLNISGVLATLLTAGATIIILLSHGGVIGLAIVGITITLLIQIFNIWLIYQIAPELRFGWHSGSRSHIRTLASYSSALFVMSLGGHLESRSDEIVIGGFLPVASVTPYNLARQLSGLPQALTGQFLTLLLPLASEIHAKENLEQLRSLYLISTRVTLAIFLPIALILVIFAKDILTLWIGANYAQYAYLILILVTASLIDTSQWPAGFVLQGMAKHHPLAIMTIASGVTNLIISILLVGRFNLMGVALGTLIPTTIVCIGFVTPYAMRMIGVGIKEMYAKVLQPAILPSIPMGIGMILLREVLPAPSMFLLLLLAMVGLLIYLAVYLLLKENDYERKLFIKVLETITVQARLRLKVAARRNE
jgi:O-antigen/teichoic acid export membrane protein